MPETPEVQELEVTVADLPMREGEKERFGSTLAVEDGRRKEALIADLKDQLRRMGGTSAGELQSRLARSPSARKRQQAVMRKIQELKNLTRRFGDTWEGPCAPATVINLNPIDLKLYGQLQRMSIPRAGKVRDDKGNALPGKVELKFRGRVFHASYVTLSTPEVWLAHTGIELDPIADSPQMEARYIPPIGLAHQFYSHYTEGAPDAQHMGGIVIFEGDIHVLVRRGEVKMPLKVNVPRAEFSADGTGDLVYSSEPRAFEEYLAAELDRQRAYAEAVIAQGHSYAISQTDEIRNQLNNGHITWHNYALERGYISAALPWASKKLTDSPLIDAVFCPDCRTRQEDAGQYFCRNCAAPFDAYKAFMAGKQVSPDRLAMYPEDSEQFKDILREIGLRKRRIELMGGVEAAEASEPKKKGKS